MKREKTSRELLIMARFQELDTARIGRFRKDFLMLMKNARRIDSYEKAMTWSKAISRWSMTLMTICISILWLN